MNGATAGEAGATKAMASQPGETRSAGTQPAGTQSGGSQAAGTQSAETQMEAQPSGGARAIAVDIVLNVVLPYGAYLLLKRAGQSDTRALILSACAPACVALASIMQRRRINGLSLLVILATGLSLGATALSGSAWFALVRPSFVTGSIAIAFLGSLALERPALFYLARDTTCPTAEEARAFEGNWASAGFRRSMRRLTVVWAVFLGGEALLRMALAAIWPDPTVVAVSQILWIVLPILLIRWSIRAGERWSGAESQPE